LNTFHTFSQIHFFHLLLLKSHWLCQSYLNTNISTETNKQTNKKVSKSMKHLLIVFVWEWESGFHFIWKWKNKYQTCEQFQIQFVMHIDYQLMLLQDKNELHSEL
jgi:hypothetical protein